MMNLPEMFLQWYKVKESVNEMVKLKLNIPEEFYREEIRCDYTVSTEMKQVWAIELDLLSELDRVCNKHDIKYCADGGTLLGAVRHKGFIPWDNDLDIAMLRSEFEKLNKVASTEFKAPYFWQTEETDPGSARGHAQLRNSDTTAIIKAEYDHQKNNNFNQGIFIDIFPFDTVIDDKIMLESQDSRRLQLKSEYRDILETTEHLLLKPWIDENGKRHWNLGRLARRIKYKFRHADYLTIYNEFISEIQKYNSNTDSKYVADLCTSLPLKRIRRYREDFINLQDAEFEFLKIPIFKNYDRNLKMLYGESYMTPIQAKNEHGGLIIDVDKPYTWYLANRR